MAVQYSVAVRNARLNALESTPGTSAKLRFYTGAPPANTAAAASGTLLVEFALASDWMADAANGTKAFNAVTPANAVASGTAGYFRLTDSAGTTTHWQGTITATGGGGDLTIDNPSLATGQQVSVSSFSFTEAGA